MDTTGLLLEFSAKNGVAGRESEAVKYGEDLLKKFGSTRISPLGSVICAVRAPTEGQAHVMLDAHIDEIGLIISYIEETGFLRVGACGGVDRRLLLASPVTAHTKNGPVKGVVCSVPPHLNRDKDSPKNKKIDEIYIDIGASSKDEAEKQVSLGDRITLDSTPRALLNGLVSGKALDDRSGCTAIIKALEYLDIASLRCGLTAVFSSMEEIGGQGAKTAAYDVNPTHAIAVDVSFAYTPDAKKEQCGELGKGPMIGFSPVLSPDMSQRLRGLAEKNSIPFQTEVMGGKTGTNADQIAMSRGGVRTALVSVPQRYMHMPIETVSVEDVENTGRLLAAFVRGIDEEGAAR